MVAFKALTRFGLWKITKSGPSLLRILRQKHNHLKRPNEKGPYTQNTHYTQNIEL